MRIKHTYDEDFENLLLDLKDKYSVKLFELNGIDDNSLDITKFSINYFLKKNTADSTIDSNANVQIKNVTTYNFESRKGHDKLNSLFLLWKTARKLYNTRIANTLIEKELIKDVNIQDLTHMYLPYCWAFDVYDIYTKGLPFVVNYPSTPPKYSDVLLQHTIQLLSYAAPQLMGATAIPNFLVIYAGLLKYDSLNNNYPVPNYLYQPDLFKKYIKQRFQELVFLLNQPLRQVQSVFSNITIFDTPFLKYMCSLYIINDSYIDSDFVMMIQKEFLLTLCELNNKQLSTFPVVTVQFKRDENNNIEDEDFLDFVSEINIPFANLNIYSDKSLTALSSCCRLINSIEDILNVVKDENTNLIGGSSVKVGSFGVASLPLVRMALKADKNEELFFSLIKENAEDCYKINHCRRTLIQDMIIKGQMPLYDLGFINLNNQYSTLGINGIEEASSLMGYNIVSIEGRNFVKKILIFLSKIAEEAIKKYNYRCNIEQIPAENTAIKLADADKLLFSGKALQHKLYANQFISLSEDVDVLQRIDLQAEFEQYFSGGTILHVNVGEKIESKEIMKKFIKFIIKSGVKYFAINYFFQKCSNNHITIDKSENCKICNGEIVERYTRIVGFLVPLSSWKTERREEFFERKIYKNGQLNLFKDG